MIVNDAFLSFINGKCLWSHESFYLTKLEPKPKLQVSVCVNLQKFAENNFIFLFIFPSIDNYLSGLKSPPLHQLYWNKSHFLSPQLLSRQSVSNNGRGDEILFILNHWKYNPTFEMPWPGRVNWKVLFEKFLATTNKGRPANTSF